MMQSRDVIGLLFMFSVSSCCIGFLCGVMLAEKPFPDRRGLKTLFGALGSNAGISIVDIARITSSNPKQLPKVMEELERDNLVMSSWTDDNPRVRLYRPASSSA